MHERSRLNEEAKSMKGQKEIRNWVMCVVCCVEGGVSAAREQRDREEHEEQREEQLVSREQRAGRQSASARTLSAVSRWVWRRGRRAGLSLRSVRAERVREPERVSFSNPLWVSVRVPLCVERVERNEQVREVGREEAQVPVFCVFKF